MHPAHSGFALQTGGMRCYLRFHLPPAVSASGCTDRCHFVLLISWLLAPCSGLGRLEELRLELGLDLHEFRSRGLPCFLAFLLDREDFVDRLDELLVGVL